MAFNYVLFSKSLASTKDKVIGLYKTRIDAIIKINAEISSLYKSKDKKAADSHLTGDDYYFKGKSRYYLVYQNNYDDLVTEPIQWGELTIQDKNGQEYLDLLNKHIRQEIKKQAKTEKKENNAVRSLLLTHKLPQPYCDDPYCWCIIDLEKYRDILQSDLDEIEDTGEYADQAWTILRGNQLKALDAVNKLQGEFAMLVGETRYVEDKFGDIGKPHQKYVYPFDDCYIYALTDGGIGKLLDDCDDQFGMSANSLANWSFSIAESNKLPMQKLTKRSFAMVHNAMFPIRITTEKGEKVQLFDAILKTEPVKDQNMFLDYFE